MILRQWEQLPADLRNEQTRHYYDILSEKKVDLLLKRLFDFLAAGILLILLLPAFAVITVLVKATSKGPVLYKQERVTIYGKKFKIFKFRTMIENADKVGSLVTIDNDNRITKVGRFLRKVRLDELPQLFNVLMGDMSFVGTRPEVQKYVDSYSSEMFATLLMPAGITSLASISFKDEEKQLNSPLSVEETYINEILPEKMRYNLEYIEKFNVFYDIKLMIKTALAVLK